MLFNSIDFAVFLPLVFSIYWILGAKNVRYQNLLIVLSSYLFYGWWDWRFLSLIAFSTFVDYSIGRLLEVNKESGKRKILLGISVFVNLGFLGFFKYYNFFLDNFVAAFSFFGTQLHPNSLEIVLPVGISFYTFQTLSYTIDVYRKKLNATHDIVAFSAYVSFFPQLVAGPIERASQLLPQFSNERHFDYNNAVMGLRQMLWGFFKKMVVADNCARFANDIFNNSQDFNGSTLALGSLFFAFQIYGDFSGYSDIAIGTARLFGIKLMRNFAFPYFSRDMAEFWRRWHISLSTWFRDYLYIPLGGSRGGTSMKIRNTFIIFVVSGFWHGANWTFLVWGALNALFFLPLLLAKKNRSNMNIVAIDSHFPSFREFLSIMATFVLTLFAWIFFRADNLTHAMQYLNGVFSLSFFQVPDIGMNMKFFQTIIFVVILVVIEWFYRTHEFPFDFQNDRFKVSRPLRYLLYATLVIVIVVFKGGQQEFIYFQF
jgi:D-alanyl-lipoteichoic acid acyltransferase DltB (MBOAT superfamily)